MSSAAPSTALPRPAPGRPVGPKQALVIALVTALAYAGFGAAALALAGHPGYASPLYPSAGIALAAALVYGRVALLGVLLGGLAVQGGLAVARGQSGLDVLPVSSPRVRPCRPAWVRR